MRQFNYGYKIIRNNDGFRPVRVYQIRYATSITDGSLVRTNEVYYCKRSMIKNQSHVLEQPRSSGLQFHLTQLIKVIDLFFSAERITQLILQSKEKFSAEQILNIQTKTTNFRVLIQCQKLYANSYWLNKKRDNNVEIRMISCLIRLYLLLSKVWQFFVGNFPNIKTRMKESTLILPLNMLKPFINEIYVKLQKIQQYYYKYENKYVHEIHIFLKAFRNILVDFPSITQVKKQFDLINIVHSQNQQYKKSYGEKYLTTKIQIRKKGKTMWRKQDQKQKRLSLDEQTMWKNKFKVITKPKNKKHSYEYPKMDFLQFINSQQVSINSNQFRPIQIEGREKKISQTSMQSTNISSPSIRNISNSKQKYEQSQASSKCLISPRSTMSPTRIQKTISRRSIISPQIINKIKQQKPLLSLQDFENCIKQKQPHLYTLQKYHSQHYYQRKNSTVISVEQQIQIVPPLTSKIPQKSDLQIEQLLQSLKSNQQISPLPQRRYKNCSSLQQIQY